MYVILLLLMKPEESSPLAVVAKIKEELLRTTAMVSDRNVQCIFNICVNTAHLSLSPMCIVQTNLHTELTRVLPCSY